MSFLRLWLLATAGIVAGAFIWAFVPILVPALVVTAGLGIIVTGVVAIARLIERQRGRGADKPW